MVLVEFSLYITDIILKVYRYYVSNLSKYFFIDIVQC
jgi:hypothetical protein